MDKRIIYTESDKVRVIVPADQNDLETLAASIVPTGVDYRITDVINIPVDRTFRDAWTDANPGETVDVDMPKARLVHMAKIRTARDKKLDELDKEQLSGKDVAAQKQALRDLPAVIDIDAHATPDDLKAFWPTELD